MKQTHKPSRQERMFLISNGSFTDGVRVIENTKEYMTVQHKDGTVERIEKGVKRP